jgi:hypothetical protein
MLESWLKASNTLPPKDNQLVPERDYEGNLVEFTGPPLQQYEKPEGKTYTFNLPLGYSATYSDNELSWHAPFGSNDPNDPTYGGLNKYDRTTGNTTTAVKYGDYYKTQDFQPIKIPATAYDASAATVSKEELIAGAVDFTKRMYGAVGKTTAQIGKLGNLDEALDSPLSTGEWLLEQAQNLFKGTSYGSSSKKVKFPMIGYEVSETKNNYVYVTRDSKGCIIDRGTMYERQIGGQVGAGDVGLGYSRGTTVQRSKFMGTTTTQKSSKWQFEFMGVSVEVE